MAKRYLGTPEEFIQALKNGQVVFDDSRYKYKLIDGFIVSIDPRGEWGINVFIKKCDGLYVEEPNPLKLQLDKAIQVTDKPYKIKEKVIREKMTEYIKEYLATHCGG